MKQFILVALLVMLALSCTYAGERAEPASGAAPSTDELLTPSASEGARLTLDQAVEEALDSHFDVLRAREAVVVLEGQITEVTGQAYPQLGLEASATTGLDESIIETSDGLIDPSQQDFYTVKATADQLLYSWGKVSAAIDAAKLERRRAERDVSSVERQIKLAVHEAYYGLLLAKRLVRVAEETVAQREAHLDVAEKRFEAGVTNEFEVIRSRVELANARVPVIQTKNRVRQSEARLNNLLARPQESPIEPDTALDYAKPPQLTLDKVVGRAIERRPELQALRLTKESAEKQLAIYSAENMPTFTAFADYGVGSEEVGDLDFQREIWTAGVAMTWPFFDGFRTQGLVVQAESRIRDASIAERQLGETITLEAKVALDSLQEAEEVYDAASLNIEQATKALELAQASFSYGVATTLDVTDAQLGLVQAQVNQAQALHDFMLARARLLSVMNDL